MKKHCTKCGKKKPLTDFYKERKSKDGHKSQCITCMKAYAKGIYIRRHVPVDVKEAYLSEIGITARNLDEPSKLTHREVLELFGSILRIENKLKVA